jgi:hypothetical protein
MTDIINDATRIITKLPYPHGDKNDDCKDELLGMGLTGEGSLQHFLALISDCIYHYEKDDDFHDGDMKIAYLTMKKAWESGGDTLPFMKTITRNRKALDWSNIMLIWCMVLDRNDCYWNDVLNFNDMGVSAAKKEQLTKIMTEILKFRNSWKKLHNDGRIRSMLVAYGKDGWEVRLFGNKEEKADCEDPSA